MLEGIFMVKRGGHCKQSFSIAVVALIMYDFHSRLWPNHYSTYRRVTAAHASWLVPAAMRCICSTPDSE